MLSSLKILSILVLAISSESSPQKYTPKATGYRLSKDIFPINYQVMLELENDVFDTKRFTGSLAIQFAVTNLNKEIKSFQIHMKNIDIYGMELLENNRTRKYVTYDDSPDPVTDLVTVTLEDDQTLAVSDYVLNIFYFGYLNDTDKDGFYLSSYKDTDGNDKNLATTKFEKIGARRVFPCFDEPTMKATFDISIFYPDGYKVLFNTEGGEPEDYFDLKWVTFQTTPVMSTYSLGFTVSEFTCTPGDTVDGIPTEVCSKIGTEETRAVALSTGAEVLQAMHDFTGIPFSKDIGKLTQIAIPDFAPGALQSWGLVTYSEEAIWWADNAASNVQKQDVITAITYELAQQWFGDMVSVAWWSDVFPNEGLATYFKYHVADVNHPEWELTNQFVIEQVQAALLIDSVDSSLPLNHDMPDSEAIKGRTDDIPRSKGGSILRMVHHFLGDDNFRKGLAIYISYNAIGSETSFWRAFEDVPADVPDSLEYIMKSWTNERGYPLVTVKSDGNNLLLSQKLFVLSGDTSGNLRYIPITYTLSNKTSDFYNTATKFWLRPPYDMEIEGLMKGQKWIILNNQRTGFYRVNYDTNLWNEISTALNADSFSDIDEISRSQIVDDLLNLARAGEKKYTDVLRLLSFLKNDESYYVWYSAFNGFNYLLQRTVDTNLRKALTSYITELMQSIIKYTPMETRAIPPKQNYWLKQILSLTWACNLGVKECVEQTRQMFVDYTQDKTKKPYVNWRTIVYCNGLRNSDDAQKDYDFLWGEYKELNLANEKVAILKALGCSNNATVRKTYLASALSDDVRKQDNTHVFSSVYSNNPGGVDDVLDFVPERYKDFPSRFGDNSALTNLISSIGDLLTTKAQIDKLTAFSNTAGLDADIKTSATDSIARAKANLEVTKGLEGKLKEYFFPTIPSSASMNSYHLTSVVFGLVGYILYNFW